MDLRKLVFTLILGTALFAGCGEHVNGTTSTTTTTMPDMGHISVCPAPGPARVYRLDMVLIPTDEQATSGVVVGQNVDGLGTSCDTPDYAGGVDNSLIALNDALPTLSADVDLQGEIDAALACPISGVDCTRLELLVAVETGGGCTVVTVRDAEGATLAGPFVASLDASGNVHGRVPSLDLSIPFAVEGQAPVDVNLAVTNVIITATVSDTALTDVVIGGVLEQDAFEATIMSLLDNTSLGESVAFEDIEGILASLYDVEIDGTCSGLSLGLRASGSVVPAT